MESLFGRKKSRLRQSSVSTQELNERSVPYDRLGPPPRSPLNVATVSQGFRGNPSTAVISAPITNPTLTSLGTDINLHTAQRNRAERDRVYTLANGVSRPDSPNASVSTADSSTLYNESLSSLPTARPKTPTSRHIRRSEASTSSGRLSPSVMDFASVPTPISPILPKSTVRPSSGVTTHTEGHRGSRYASSVLTDSPHLSQYFHRHRDGNQDGFDFPRPEKDEEVEALFEHVKMSRGLPDMQNLNLDQKWTIVYSDEHLRWKEERSREELARKQSENGQPAQIGEGTPEWYIKRFLDNTITAKQASSLSVSMRGNEMSWFHHFLSIHGTSVLAQALMHISRKGPNRRDADIQLEYEIVKCMKHIFNSPAGASEAISHTMIVTQLTSSLNTPHLPTRKIILELLLAVVYMDRGFPQLLINALEALSSANNETGCYEYWFKSMEIALKGRGKMGSLVGASEDVKKNGGIESSLNEYALCNMLLINGMIEVIEDLDLRLHHRAQMESAGLHRIVDLCRAFQVPFIDLQLGILQDALEEDERRLRERLDQEILRDLSNAQDVYNAIRAKTQGSRAEDYFLSMMQHLLLIREEGPAMVHYYQLLNAIVTDVVLDKKLSGAEQRLGHSVEHIIAHFNEAERLQVAEDEAAQIRAEMLQLKLDNQVLEEEVAQGHGGLVGQLKEKVLHLEKKLDLGRDTITKLRSQLETQKAGYEEQIAQLEAQIMELFRMLKEVNKGVDKILESNSGSMDRKMLLDELNKHMQRTKTISILEGRDSKEILDKPPSSKSGGKQTTGSNTAKSISANMPDAQNGRTSQFMDADEADVQEQIQQQLAEGIKAVGFSPKDGFMSSPRSIRGSPRHTERTLLHTHSSSAIGSSSPYQPEIYGASSPTDEGREGSGDERGIHASSNHIAPRDNPRHMSIATGGARVSGQNAKQALILASASETSLVTLATLPEEPDSNLANLLSARKDLPVTPSTKMKQLQWDKLPQQQVAKTLWNQDETQKESEILQKLSSDGIWMEMEEDFKAKQLVINLMARHKHDELRSVLDPQTKKRIEILIQRVKKMEPEEIARKIQRFDQDMCTEVFLSELKPVLPTPEQVGKLNVYRNSAPEELAGLHPSDRLMVKLIQIDRLGPRIEGMLYKCKFDETWSLLDDGTRKLEEAGEALLHAKHFKEVLNLILIVGNYMNGTGIKGGAFGFRVSSINKLVDTKSVNNTTLLHFLERTVSKHFTDMEAFLDELSKPAEAYRVNLQDIRKELAEMRNGLKRIRQELNDHYVDTAQNDQYSRQMWSFVGKASSQLEDLVDDVNRAEAIFAEVVKYYGEDDKNMSSAEFYGIFKTFVISYKKCQNDNQSAAEERIAIEKRKQALAESRVQRQKASEAESKEDTVLDSLLEKLRNGDTVGRRTRRTRLKPDSRPAMALALDPDRPVIHGSLDTADVARDMLARLQSDQFSVPIPVSPVASPSRRRERQQLESTSAKKDTESIDISDFGGAFSTPGVSGDT
ncbi:hypothetical protein SERLA73DRAFT_162010 [Serpula lacrymans var. lacrymans S7.3]|uniref:Cytokinesis protein sepA n=1 Tax=Serpula lacrymans var. lacrymans (strain S7.3) TaxID=936435 RepID=F8Q604_SERL3|nr:hypothetical protein SERLA73DRAFT_162010 [Serpula lacrymans var. lacrymans S7.3]